MHRHTAIGRRILFSQGGRNYVEPSLCLSGAYILFEPSHREDHSKTAIGPKSGPVFVACDRTQWNVAVYFKHREGSVEFLRKHADNCHGDPVNAHFLPDN